MRCAAIVLVHAKPLSAKERLPGKAFVIQEFVTAHYE